MTRKQAALTSLVAWIPAMLLTAILVMVFLNHSLPTMGYVIVGATLACCLVVDLTPFALLIFKPKPPKPAAAKLAKGKAAAAADDGESEGDGDDEFEASDELIAEDVELTDEVEETMDFDTSEVIEEAPDTDDEIFEDEPPKKKGKKR